MLLGYGHWSLTLAQRAVFRTDNFLEFSQETETVALTQGFHPAIWSHDEQTLRILAEAVCGMEHPSEKENRIGKTAQPGPQSPGRLHDSGTNERETVWGILASVGILGSDYISGSMSQALPLFEPAQQL